MRRLKIAALVAMSIGVLATPALGASEQVSICHATGSAKNPFVLIHPAAAGVVKGHLAHQHGADVVPPFLYKGTWYSQNWDTGRALFEAGCRAGISVPPGEGGGGSF